MKRFFLISILAAACCISCSNPQKGECSNEIIIQNTSVSSEIDLEYFKKALLDVETTLYNSTGRIIEGKLCGTVNGKSFRRKVEINPGEEKTVLITSDKARALRIKKPHIWWCHNVGNPEMYTLELSFIADRKLSGQKTLDFCIRKLDITTDEDGRKECILNGKKVSLQDIVCHDMVSDPETELEYAKDMNLNTIVVESASKELYDLCDHKGFIVIEGSETECISPSEDEFTYFNYEDVRSAFEKQRLNSEWKSLVSPLHGTMEYWAVKKTYAPQQLIYNKDKNFVFAVNDDKGEVGLTAKILTYDQSGKLVSRTRSFVNMTEGVSKHLFRVPAIKTDLGFIFLSLEDENGNIVSRNEYCISGDLSKREYRSALDKLARTEVAHTVARDGNSIKVKLENKGTSVAFFIEAELKTAEGEITVPTLWNDNFVTLAPGETRTLTCHSTENIPENAIVTVSGLNTL